MAIHVHKRSCFERESPQIFRKLKKIIFLEIHGYSWQFTFYKKRLELRDGAAGGACDQELNEAQDIQR